MIVNKLALISSFAFLSVCFNSTVFAAQSIQKVKIELAGEADQPMKIVVDSAPIKAGTVVFDVTNSAIGTDHEMVLVKLASADSAMTPDPKTHRIDESKLKSLGEVAGLKAGDTGKLKVKLAPGEYALICNHKSHYELGMATRFTVVQ